MECLKSFSVSMPDGETKKVRLCNVTMADKERLTKLFQSVPQDEVIHFDRDIMEENYVARILQPYQRNEFHMICSIMDDEITGICSLTRVSSSWSRHVGELRLYVQPEYRHVGIGLALLNELYYKSLSLGIEKLIGMIPSKSMAMFRDLMSRIGMTQEAVLKDHIKDAADRKQDLLIFSCSMANMWELISDWQSPYGRAMEY